MIESAFEDRVGPAGEIERNLGSGFVHGQQETVAGDAVLVAERLAQGLAEGERGVLDRVMFVDRQVAGALEFERKAAVTGDLFEHVIEERDSGRDVHRSAAVEIELDLDCGLAGPAFDPSRAPRFHQPSRHGFPGLRGAALVSYTQPGYP
jgi:hypothetical protein